jgi:multiple sugar transport system permease protein
MKVATAGRVTPAPPRPELAEPGLSPKPQSASGGGVRRALYRARARRGPWHRRVPWVLALPGLFVLVVFYAWPAVVSIYISLTKLNVFYLANWLSAPFVGLGNFTSLFNPKTPFGHDFLGSLEAAGIFTGSAIVLGVPLGLLAAVAMNRKMKGRAVFRVLFILPYAIPIYVSTLIWRFMLIQKTGLVDHIASVVGGSGTCWLIGPNAIWAIVMANVWASWPFFYLFALASMQGVPGEIYEAAAMDGAGGVATFARITLPLIKRPMVIAVILSFIFHFNNFTTPFVMFGTTPPSSADTLPLSIYLYGFNLENFGVATAMSVLSMVVLMVPVLFYLRTSRPAREPARR